MLKALNKIVIAIMVLQGSTAFAQNKDIKLSAAVELPALGNSQLHYLSAADFNGDKLVDLILGNFKGEITVRINEGTKERPVYRTEKKLKSDNKDILIEHW